VASSTSSFPRITSVRGLIEGPIDLPATGTIGDAWYEESAGKLWVWDPDAIRWCEVTLWRGGSRPHPILRAPSEANPEGGASSDGLLQERLRKLSPQGVAAAVDFIEFLIARERRDTARRDFLDGMNRQRAIDLPRLPDDVIDEEVRAAAADVERAGGV
jgi:hypothetical protein